MNPNNKYWWFVALSFTVAFTLLASLLFFLWQQLAPAEKRLLIDLTKEHFIYIFGVGFVLIAGFGFILDAIFHNYIIPINKLTEENHPDHSP